MDKAVDFKSMTLPQSLADIEDARQALVQKIGENISFDVLALFQLRTALSAVMPR